MGTMLGVGAGLEGWDDLALVDVFEGCSVMMPCIMDEDDEDAV